MQTASGVMQPKEKKLVKVRRKEWRKKREAKKVENKWFCISFPYVLLSSGPLRRVQWIYKTESPQKRNTCSMPVTQTHEERWEQISRKAIAHEETCLKKNSLTFWNMPIHFLLDARQEDLYHSCSFSLNMKLQPEVMSYSCYVICCQRKETNMALPLLPCVFHNFLCFWQTLFLHKTVSNFHNNLLLF